MNKATMLLSLTGTMLCMASCTTVPDKKENVSSLVSYVDPYIGSGEHGHVFVGANVPFGMIQAGPQNIHKGWDWCSGYHYSDSIIIGFSHTHLSGTGCADLGDILLMPYSGEVKTKRGEQDNIEGAASSYYKHENETVSPGYYSLSMDNGVKAELTATARAAMHHYQYPEGDKRLLINLREGNGDGSYETYIKLIDRNTVEGYRYSKGWSPRHKVHFVLKSEQPIVGFQVFNDDDPAEGQSLKGEGVKGVLTFDAKKDVKVKLAISSVSCENALANLNAEMQGWDFDKVHKDAVAKWEDELSAIQVQSTNERSKKTFYTALYHMYVAPTLYCDVNGEYRGHDDKVYKAEGWKNYSTFSLWDTYRTLHPLMTILQPELVPDMVNSMLSIYDQQGKLPIWPLVGGETNQMPGYSAVPVIADAYVKGFKGFDGERALNAMISSSTNPNQNGISYVLEREYIPADKVGEATSVAMEYAIDDWGTALMAKKMGKEDVYKTYLKRGHFYKHYFDTTINFVRPKLDDGSWRTPYSPFKAKHGGSGDFCEGNGWQYTFFVPQHPEGLVELMGGDAVFCSKLDSLFVASGDMSAEASADISGLIGMYAHGNEPSHHVVYMYPYAGQQWKTAEKVRFIQENFYTDKPDGIIGNEDCGQMSSWHVISALGFYQVNPSHGVLVFGSPLFEDVKISLPGNKIFEVEALNNSKENIYIQSVTLNGKPYDKSYILYEDVMKGGKLSFVMGNQPNKDFGAAPSSRPTSL